MGLIKETKFPRVLSLLLATLALGCAYYLVSQASPAYTTATFYHKYYGHAFPPDSLLAAGDSHPHLRQVLERAGKHFADSAYQKALVEVRSAQASTPHVPALFFYEGLCALYLKQGHAATAAFDQVLAMDSTLTAPASWYRALTFVQHNEREKALVALQVVKAPYDQQAKALLADLE